MDEVEGGCDGGSGVWISLGWLGCTVDGVEVDEVDDGCGRG